MINKTPLFGTTVINLEKIVAKRFTIPTYQRPYVWGYDQITTLLNDFYVAFSADSTSTYYIGTVLTKETEGYIEQPSQLIDGQQRFTTLWLIAYSFNKLGVSCDLTQFLRYDNALRITFEIRKEVEEYLQLLLNNNVDSDRSVLLIKNPFVKHIAAAVATIENFLVSKESLEEFGNYIYRNIHLVNNSTPIGVDLNKLFTTINSSGIQLDQTDVLKSKLLKKLSDKKEMYSQLWECCANTSAYFEKNFRDVFGTDLFKKYDFTKVLHFNDLPLQASEYEVYNDEDGWRISEIIVHPDIIVADDKFTSEEERKSEEVLCRSLISFPQLLIHTYRIYLCKTTNADVGGTFHVNRLLELFENLIASEAEDIISFLELLWETRQVFDLGIIKWVTDLDSKKETLEMVNMSRNSEGYYSKSNYAVDTLHQLQSMLYFTGDYLRQYWLSPYLSYLLDNKENSKEQALDALERIDNLLSLSSLTDKEATWLLMKGMDLKSNIDLKKELNAVKGVRFKHYWFQKLEYVLYKNWNNKEDDKFKRYRITSKNSVEHVNPQTPKNGNPLADKFLNCFGNLVLLSVAQNSEYSNKYLEVKRAEFHSKFEYDTLKSAIIFNIDKFDEVENIEKHQSNMIQLLQNHYNAI